VLAFITAQRTGQAGERGALHPVTTRDEPSGVPAATVRRRLSVVSGLFAFLQARGDVVASPVPRGCPPAGAVLAGARRPAALACEAIYGYIGTDGRPGHRLVVSPQTSAAPW
jgi:hypothetical protein